MDDSYRSLHRLPILNCDGVSSNAKQKYFKSICGNNDRYRMNFVPDKKKNEPQKEKANAINSKTKSRQKSASHKNLKKTLSNCSNYLKRLTQHRSTANTNKNKNNIKNSTHNKQIKVLFSSEARKTRNKRSNINQDLINEIYNCNAVNYDNGDDMCKTSMSNFKKRPNILRYDAPIRKRQRSRQQYTLNTTNRGNTLCKSSPKSTRNVECYDIQEQYKVVQFPDFDQTESELEAINMGRNDDLRNLSFLPVNGYDLQNDKQVAFKPNVCNAQRGAGDAACTVSVQCLDPRKDCIKLENTNNGFVRFLDPLIIHENVLRLAKVALKYLIFGLVLIVWSPCIITLYFCWFITYPLRPSYTSTSTNRNSRSRRKSQHKVYVCGSKHVTDNSMQTCRKNNAWLFLLESVSWAYQPIAVSFGVFKSLLNPRANNLHLYQCSTNEQCGRKDRVIKSDPGKKYTLYYNRSKGWVLKSTKRRKCKEVPKVRYGSHCCNDRKPIAVTCRQPQRNCCVRAGKHTIENNNKICVQNHCRSRHKHLCADASGLPVRVKLSNPFNNNVSSERIIVKPVNKTKPIAQSCKRVSQCERVRYPKKKSKKRSRCKGVLTPKPRLKLRNKIWRYCKELKCKIKSIVDEVETEVFGRNFCQGIYVQTLRKKPCYYIYEKCPSFYPVFMGIYKFYENSCHFFLLFCSACIWCPILGFFFICYEIFWKSLLV